MTPTETIIQKLSIHNLLPQDHSSVAMATSVINEVLTGAVPGGGAANYEKDQRIAELEAETADLRSKLDSSGKDTTEDDT